MKTSPSRPADRRVQTVCLLILTLIAVPVALYFLQPVLVPFILAIFFSQCLTPLIDSLMRRFRWPQVIAVSVAALVGVALVVGVGFLLSASISGMTQDQFKEYQERLTQQMDGITKSAPVQWLGQKAGVNAASAIVWIKEIGVETFAFLAALAGTILKNTVTVLILMAFLLFGRKRTRQRSQGILGEIEIRVQRYISLTVAISILTGLLVGVSLSLLGVQFAAGFGFLAFLLNFIPNLGAVVATVLPLPIAYLGPHGGFVTLILALAIPSLIQVLIGFMQPRLMGQSLDLHPVVVLLSLLFFAMIWGLAGAFLATPLTAVIKIVLEKIPATRPLAALLAGNLGPLVETIDDTPPLKSEEFQMYADEKNS